LWEGNIDRGYMGSPTKKEHKNDNSLLSYPAKAMLKKKRLQQKGYRERLQGQALDIAILGHP
jgi:hypothetical protein